MLPYKTKICEPLPLTSREEREMEMAKAGYNVYSLPAETVTIDLLSDSGTSAMSQEQWSRMILADESITYSRSYFHFVEKVKEVFGYEYVLPVHQGRSGEHILFKVVVNEGDHLPSNGHYATTQENIHFHGGVAVSLLTQRAFDPHSQDSFKGEMDLDSLKSLLEKECVPLSLLTITNNDGAGQPVSLKHIREVSKLLRGKRIPLFFDACRFAENSFLIQKKEKGYEKKTIPEIVKETFSWGDGCFMSMKKDGLSNVGGFLALKDGDLYEKLRSFLLLIEGFHTEGGMAGRDLEAMVLGLEEVLEETYLTARVEQVHRLGERLLRSGVPVYQPFGGHAVYLLAGEFVPHISPEEFPSEMLASEIYVEGGIRTLPVGIKGWNKRNGPDSGIQPFFEMIRLAIPRRVYSESHMDYVAEVIGRVYKRKESIRGLCLTYDPPFLKHYIARFEKI